MASHPPLAGLYFFLLSLVVALPVSAQQTNREQARAAFSQGVERYGRGEYANALQSFEAAYRLQPHPAVLLNIASCHERLGNLIEALAAYERYLGVPEAGTTPEQRDVSRTSIERIRARIGEVTFDVSPDGARVYVDGRIVGIAPLNEPVRLLAGAHDVEVAATGYRSETRTVDVRAGDKPTVQLALTRPPPTKKSREEVSTTLVDEGTESREPNYTPAIVTGSLTLACAAAGVITSLLALGAQSDFDDSVNESRRAGLGEDERRRIRNEGLDAADRADTFAWITDTLFLTAIVGAGVTTYFLLTARPSARPKVAFHPGRGSTPLGLRLEF